MTDITKILAKLDPKTRDRVLAASSVKVEKQKTPSLGLNNALGGGLPYGRQVLVWGNKSAGKSSLCLQVCAEAQNEGRVAAWIDAEQSFDPDWAARLGVDTDSLLVTRAKDVETMTNNALDFIRAGVDIIVVDSVSALLSSAFFGKKDDELKDLNDTKQIGSLSRDLANSVNMINYANDNTMIIFISQLRNQISQIGAFPKPMGGFAMQFFSSTILKLWSSPNDDKQIKGDTYIGDRIVSKNIGRPVNWLVEFNKTSSPGDSGSYDFYYDGSYVGVDQIGEAVDYAITLGLVVKAGAWFKYDGQSYQGKRGIVEFFRDNESEHKKLLSTIHTMVTGEIDG
jgi:recombination protein RecA